jgi:transposase
MHNTTLYEQILGLRAPWSVKSVTLKKDEGVIEVEVVCEETRLVRVKKVVRLFEKHWANIVTYFRHHLSNAASEGLNSRIQQLIQKACGI